MKIGFTGTHHGMTQAQRITFRSLLSEIVSQDPLTRDEFHHGDCIGADSQANDIAWAVGCSITVHPPTEPRNRFFCKAETQGTQTFTILPEKPYMVRDKDIVNGSTRMFATPVGTEEELRSGTWATIRYARKKKIPLTIIWPDGSTTQEN